MSGSYPRGLKQKTKPLPSLSNATADPVNDITIGVGQAQIGSAIANVLAPFTKRLDAEWVKGDNQGGRFPGVALENNTYHVFLIRNGLGEVDGGFDTSVIGANTPSGFTPKRICSILRLNNQIKGFIQIGAFFELKNISVADVEGAFIPAIGALYRVSVPTGIKTIFRGILSPGLSAVGSILNVVIQSPSQEPLTPSGADFISPFKGSFSTYHSGSFFTAASGEVQVLTNTNGEVRMASSGAYSGAPLYSTTLQPLGWVDLELAGGF